MGKGKEGECDKTRDEPSRVTDRGTGNGLDYKVE